MLDTTIREAARRWPDAPALIGPAGRPVTYRQLDDASDHVGRWLLATGIGEGSVVGLALASTPDYVVAYLGAAKVGAITCGINPKLSAPEQQGLIDTIGVDLLLRTPPDTALAATAAGGPADDGADGAIAAVGNIGFLTIEVPTSFDDITLPSVLDTLRHTGAAPDKLAALEPDPNRVVALVCTSGTTGTPKAAVFCARQLRAVTELDLGDRANVWGGGAPMIASTQFAHVGFMTKLAWYLQVGAPIHLMERWSASRVLSLVRAHGIRTIGGVAPQIALLLRSAEWDNGPITSVQQLIVGGAASPPGLVAAARERFGAHYSIRYSSTESGGVGLATDPTDPEAAILHTIGKPRAGIDARVWVGDHDAQPGEVGELLLRSPAMMSGYWNAPDATAAAIRDGWLYTGDLASFDESGYFTLAGRTTDMFIRGGYNVFPSEVEAVISEHPAVAEVTVVPRPDPMMGEIGVAYVVPRTSSDRVELSDLREFANDRLASFKLPEAIVVLDSMPLTPMHKTDRKALLEADRTRTGG